MYQLGKLGPDFNRGGLAMSVCTRARAPQLSCRRIGQCGPNQDCPALFGIPCVQLYLSMQTVTTPTAAILVPGGEAYSLHQ